jgi:hypothetical protein
MKNLSITLCTVISFLIAVTACAQQIPQQKPFLFKNHPATIELTDAQLGSLFSGKPGNKISMPLSSNLSIEGPVISNIKKYSNLQTMAIKLPAFNNILFSLSKRIDNDKSVVYAGHLFSKDFADGYELKRISSNAYQLVKIEMEKMLPTCNL